MSAKRSTTMQDVARAAQVSTATVSRVLNDDPSVTSSTRKRVKREADRLGYVIARQARALRSRRTGTIAVHVPITDRGDGGVAANPFVLEFLAAVGTELHFAGLDMLVPHSSEIDLSLHRSGLVDGYLQLGYGVDDTAIGEAAQAGLPVAVWAPPAPGRAYSSVGVNNVELADRAVTHLVELGRRRIGIISGDLDYQNSEGCLRHDGYRAALERAGLDYDPTIVASAEFVDQVSGLALDQLLAAEPDIDAIFVGYGDVIALSVARRLREKGISIPERIALVGFDNIDLADFVHPRLTTIDQNLTAGIPLLIDELRRLIEGEAPRCQTVEGSLVVRESCGSGATGRGVVSVNL